MFDNKSGNIAIVQPLLAPYRVPIFEEMSELNKGSVSVFSVAPGADYGSESEKYGFDFFRVKWRRFFCFYSIDVSSLKEILKNKDIIHFADFKYLSLWLVLFFSFFSKNNIWLHGQGGYKRKGLAHRLFYFFTILFSKGYICYNDYSCRSLKSILPTFMHSKIHVVENTLYIEPIENIIKATSNDLFYIGRLREGCGLEILLQAAQSLGVEVRAIGSGDPAYEREIMSKYNNLRLYGAVFERDKQRVIAQDCLAGAYGGDAGLSVVHYMAFGLPVIVHSDLRSHMGPEPSYVAQGVNGVFFERNNVSSLSEAIYSLINNGDRNRLAQGSLDTFNDLSKPTMAEKFLNIIRGGL